MGYVLNMFIDIQTSKELIQMGINKMMTYAIFTMNDEKTYIVRIKHNRIRSSETTIASIKPFSVFYKA